MSENDHKDSQYTIFWQDKENDEMVYMQTIFADSLHDACMQAIKMKAEDKMLHNLTWTIDYTKINEQLTI